MQHAPPDEPPESPPSETPEQFRARFIDQLKEDNFVLYFQPIAPASSPHESNFREILARYREEEAGLLPPGSFLPILEEQGLLPLLDRWVVSRLLIWGRRLQASGKRMPHCSVNLSIQTVREDASFGEYVVKGLERAGVAPASLTFEILTADAHEYAPEIARFMAPLKAAGVTFALSWFAGEELALTFAPKMGFTYIKLDGSLIANIAKDTNQQAKLSALLQRCRKAGLRTVCMWVENAETLAHLRALGVDYVQGFGVARPKPLEGA
ncbi:MAG TPA: EAL domain-containing protein [Usitatibacter sp.]|jgi:EAL domain-containing protein (putative c-di-GMP-specific phosphodiesterase class I)